MILLGLEEGMHMTELEKSPNWDAYKDSVGFIEEGFPFKEGFPKEASSCSRKLYTLIFRDGSRLLGAPDYSRQYRAEGTQWRIVEGGFAWLDQHVVVAWCEVGPDQPQAA